MDSSHFAVFDESKIQEIKRPRASIDEDPKLKPTPISSPVIWTDFAELDDGSLIEMIEDPENPSRTLLAVFQGAEGTGVHYVREYQHAGETFAPIPRESEIVRHVRLPRGARPYESVERLLEQIDSILSSCLDLEEKYRFLLASFALSTWFIERLPVAPYVALVGLPRSGKSTVLKVLSLLCRRSLMTADITSAAFYRVCDRLTPTLLIDETSTAGDKRKLFHLLRTGISRDVVALRRDQSFNAFGAKVVSWTELPNDAALNSRCIVIPLHETRRTDLKRPTDKGILQAADELQMQLLQYRLQNYRSLSSVRIPDDARLYSRARDLYETLAIPLGEHSAACQRLLNYITLQQDFTREPLYPPHAAVLEYLYRQIHSSWYAGTTKPITVGSLTPWINRFLEERGEHFRLNSRQVGAALTALGILNRKRTRTGWEILLDRQDRVRIHELFTFYGFDHVYEEGLVPDDSIKKCEFCTNLEDPVILVAKKGSMSLYEHSLNKKDRTEW